MAETDCFFQHFALSVRFGVRPDFFVHGFRHYGNNDNCLRTKKSDVLGKPSEPGADEYLTALKHRNQNACNKTERMM